jgi:hypothetical protein
VTTSRPSNQPSTTGAGYGYGYPSASYASSASAASSHSQQGYFNSSYGYPQQDYSNYAAPPQIANPFPVPGQEGYGAASGAYDPDYESQVAEWQSAYAGKDEAASSKHPGGSRSSNTNPNLTALGSGTAKPADTKPLTTNEINSAANNDTGVASVVAGADGREKTVIRKGGGKVWSDPSLLEWDPAHFRFFVGNLAGEVTDDSLYKAFSKYPSLVKAKVVRDKRTTKSQGYGFVSFRDGDDFFTAAKEMQGKYIGSHPVLIRRSTTEIRATVPKDQKGGKGKLGKHGKSGKGNGGGGGAGGDGGRDRGGGHADTGAGISKPGKAKGGMKLLG